LERAFGVARRCPPIAQFVVVDRAQGNVLEPVAAWTKGADVCRNYDRADQINRDAAGRFPTSRRPPPPAPERVAKDGAILEGDAGVERHRGPKANVKPPGRIIDRKI